MKARKFWMYLQVLLLLVATVALVIPSTAIAGPSCREGIGCTYDSGNDGTCGIYFQSCHCFSMSGSGHEYQGACNDVEP